MSTVYQSADGWQPHYKKFLEMDQIAESQGNNKMQPSLRGLVFDVVRQPRKPADFKRYFDSAGLSDWRKKSGNTSPARGK